MWQVRKLLIAYRLGILIKRVNKGMHCTIKFFFLSLDGDDTQTLQMWIFLFVYRWNFGSIQYTMSFINRKLWCTELSKVLKDKDKVPLFVSFVFVVIIYYFTWIFKYKIVSFEVILLSNRYKVTDIIVIK